MLYKRMNEVNAPFRIEIDGADKLNQATYYYLMLIECSVGRARLQKSIETGLDTDVDIAVFA